MKKRKRIRKHIERKIEAIKYRDCQAEKGRVSHHLPTGVDDCLVVVVNNNVTILPFSLLSYHILMVILRLKNKNFTISARDFFFFVFSSSENVLVLVLLLFIVLDIQYLTFFNIITFIYTK